MCRKIKVQFIFEGVVTVDNSETISSAIKTVKEGFNVSLNEPNVTNKNILKWDIESEPEKNVIALLNNKNEGGEDD